MNKKSYDKFFMNFANETRQRIIGCLMEREMSVGEITAEIGEEQSNVSHHLAHLIKCRILRVKKQGQKRIYTVNKRTVKPMLALVEKHMSGNCSCCPMSKSCFGG